ncbi:MAG: hypothetical protein KGH56_00755 [Patescibacteria group bacterium]|nr:hypothetical protein [Patescibacteria group bacterium]
MESFIGIYLKNNGVARLAPRERGTAAQDEACLKHVEAEPFGSAAVRGESQ